MSDEEIRLFKEAVVAINQTYAMWAEQKNRTVPISWPKKLRIKPLAAAPGIFELTWSFSGPDGRATFEFITIDGELAIRWRRIGNHAIFKNP